MGTTQKQKKRSSIAATCQRTSSTPSAFTEAHVATFLRRLGKLSACLANKEENAEQPSLETKPWWDTKKGAVLIQSAEAIAQIIGFWILALSFDHNLAWVLRLVRKIV